MNILELDSFNLADAVKFNDQLNPRIWQGNKMRPEVREKLLEIAEDFREFLGVDNLDVRDITVSGSNASYHYTPYSDIDLHLVVDVPKLNDDAIFRELFDAKKYQYNDLHNIRIGGYEVELYVEDAGKPPVSQGIFSVLNNDWINIPKKRRATVDDTAVKSKYEDIKHRIESALKDQDFDRIDRLAKKLKAYRQAGLDKHGEFGPENIAFKMLRNHGLIKKLYDARNAARDAELSLNERKKKKKRVKYGFARTWGPVFDFGDGGEGGGEGMAEDATLTPDGVNPTTCMFLNEKEAPNQTEIIFDFMKFAVGELGLKNVPALKIKKDPQWSVVNKSFGRYRNDLEQIDLAVGNRHIMDVLRTLAHELQHRKQDEREHMPSDAGKTGSRFENEAHAVAGVLMRKYADLHPEYFDDVPVSESASGYIPKNKKEAAMPQYAMALSVDIKPGETGRQANKMALKTDSQGKPGLLMKTANMIGESVPQPGPSSGAPKKFGPDAKIQTRQMTAKDIISSVPGVPYYNNVVDDWDAKDYSWGVTKKVIEYANYLKQHPETLSQLPPAIVLNGKFEDGAHRVSALWLLQQRMDPKNPLWKNAKLNVQFVQQGITEGKSYGYNATPLSQVPGEQEDDLGNQEATGPEFEPQMPAGTTKIDVVDLTDWYKLGQDISDLDDADPADYGKGPPQTVVVFPSDEAEQGYLKQFKRLGLKTHDMDPDVEGGEDVEGKHLNKALAEELQAFKEQDLFEVKMTSKNLAKLAKDIPGATVGLEFEMIVPNVNGSDGGDMEPNYAEDERVRDIDDCVNFFDDGDYNDRGTIRRLRADMEEAYFEWKIEQVDERWNGNQGWEFFQEYLDREEPFDEEDYLDQARDIVADKHPELEVGTDDYEVALREVLDQINSTYYTDQWEEQGRNYDNAREEFEDEISDDISESDWLDSEGIRYASDVESNYDVTWPYWDSPETETDSKEIALNFMNYMGYDTIAVGDYHGYGGGYQLWNGSEWVKIGSNKPMDAFTVEPDGSLSGDDSGDTGLEFVSPPIPLDQIGETMKKVQAWASENGAYTGKRNSTSMHTNISIPGYDLDKLDYLKAAILLGDEYVLRQFDRIGNTYAKPAIEKVKQLVQQKPEKAQELLDKMKSHLNAEASKLIHSGQTDKYTSINTKDNRIEFRSPGGDYLSDIADNPQKMQDTINRMVVVLDAAMDPNKYKEEYQKKLYKILTGQGGGREAKTGAKQEMKASDKDLINIFTRYAAGEMPKAALKSFVRQAQLERGISKGKAPAGQKYWWSVTNPANNAASIEVVAASKEEAIKTAVEPGNYPEWARVQNTLQATPLRPYEEKPKAQSAAASDQGNWGIWMLGADRFANQPGEYPRGATPPLYRFPSKEAAEQWIEQQRSQRPRMRTDIEVREIEPQAAAQGAGPSVAGRASNPEGNWILAPQGQTPPVPLFRFNAASVDDANNVVNQWNRENSGGEEVVVHYDPQQRYGQPPVPGSTLDRARQRAQAAQQGEQSSYELYRISDGRAVTAPAGNPIVFRATDPEDAESKIARYAADFNLGAPELFAVRSVLAAPAQQPATKTYELYNRDTGEVIETFPARNDNEAMIRLNDFRDFSALARQNPQWDVGVRQQVSSRAQQPTTQFGANTPAPMYEIVRNSDNEVVHRFFADSSDEAYEQASDFMIMQRWNPDDYSLQPADQAPAAPADDWSAEFERRVSQPAVSSDAAQGGLIDVPIEIPDTAPRTLTTPGQPQQQFTGEWKVVDPQGREIYRFGGVGNSQSDANRVAMQWLQRNPRHMQGGVEVLPVMG